MRPSTKRPGENPTATSRSARGRRDVLIAVLAAVLGLGLAEGLTRAFLLAPASPKTYTAYGWVEEAHSRAVFSREGYSISRRNSLGFDDDEPRPDAALGRVLLLGDSYAQSHQVSRGQGFPFRAEALLPEVDVVNVARSGDSPLEYAAYLPALLATFHPRLVVLQVNDGDVSELIAAGRRGETPESALEAFRRRDRRRENSGLLKRWGKRLAQHSALANLVLNRSVLLAGKEERRLRGKLGPAAAQASDGMQPEDPVAPEAPAFMDGLLAEMRAETDLPLLLLYIPNLVYASDGCRNKWPHRREFWQEFASRNGVPLVDCTDALREVYRTTGQPAHGFQNSIMGTGHINARGHEAVARLLAPAIRNLLS